MPRSSPRPAVRPTLATRAYEDLRALFQDGTYSPGDFLTEGELARRLRMSKTPVRTALTRLEMDGFVTVSPQQGIVVREPSIHEIVDLFDIRTALETFVVRRLAGNLTPEPSTLLMLGSGLLLLAHYVRRRTDRKAQSGNLTYAPHTMARIPSMRRWVSSSVV